MRLLKRDAQAGFTIVEVVLAMGILLVGAAAILSMLTFGASMTRAAQLRTAAATAVEAVRADLEANMFPYDPLLDGEDAEVGPPKTFVDRAVPGVRGDPRGVVDGQLRVELDVTGDLDLGLPVGDGGDEVPPLAVGVGVLEQELVLVAVAQVEGRRERRPGRNGRRESRRLGLAAVGG